MIIDASAIIAILRKEPNAEFCTVALGGSDRRSMSAANYLEAALVVDGQKNPILSRALDEFIADVGINLEPVTVEQAKLAREAYRDFGRGSGHPAKLNFGDCFAYALAKDKREPLLCVGNDFMHTDVETICPSQVPGLRPSR